MKFLLTYEKGRQGSTLVVINLCALADFTFSEQGGKVLFCPKSHVPSKTKRKKECHSATFEAENCAGCPLLGDCQVKPGKRGDYLEAVSFAATVKAAGLNIRRAAVFRYRKQPRKTGPVAGLIATGSYKSIVKEQFSAFMRACNQCLTSIAQQVTSRMIFVA